MRIVFLNLADMAEEGLAKKSVSALKEKYPERAFFSNPFKWMFNNNMVECINMIDLYKKKDSISLSFIAEWLKIAVSCDIADKIMLAIHGRYNDTTRGYIEEFGEPPIQVNYRELANFVSMFLPNRSESYHLSLIMCYSARSDDFLVNHEGVLSRARIQSSFAYKFFREIRRLRNVRMTARTGAVSFSRDGKSLVESETAVGYSISFDRVMKKYERAKEPYEKLKERIFSKDGVDGIRSFNRREENIKREIEKGRTDWSMASLEELIVINYLKIVKVLNRLAPLRNDDRVKYGKFIYTYEDGVCRVVKKYPRPMILYSGAL